MHDNARQPAPSLHEQNVVRPIQPHLSPPVRWPSQVLDLGQATQPGACDQPGDPTRCVRPNQVTQPDAQLWRTLQPLMACLAVAKNSLSQICPNPCRQSSTFSDSGHHNPSYHCVNINLKNTQELTELNSDNRSSRYKLSKLLGLIVKHSFQCLNYIENS